MATLHRTSDEIREALLRQQRQRRERRRALRPIRLIDALLEDLEELHLAGRQRVPVTVQPRLAELETALPAELTRELPTRVTIVHLMDLLYEVQDALLSRKTPGRGPGDGEEMGARLPEAS
ncbi:MAG: hypothetical protein E6J14_04165 [Chloroflexi bacterium]|nr:MAG: hypothetical protein E6J14_04165 [Chloroflexota bacterium]